MPGGRLLGLLLAAAATACQSSSTPLPHDASAEGGGDATTACACQAPDGLGGEVTIPCRAIGCAGGLLYLCSATGDLLSQGPCNGASDASTADVATCQPTCTGKTCGNGDGCGGVCRCSSGLPCNVVSGVCGNGCELSAGDPCDPDAGTVSPGVCCKDGYQCARSDGGYAGCCVTSGGIGQCATSQDCCAYPAAQCNPSTHACQ